jgi:hypothetical protein
MKFIDGIVDLFNSLANTRNATQNNAILSTKIMDNQLNEVYKTGLGNKIVRVKSGYALKSNSINFTNNDDKTFYIAKLEEKVKEAFMWSLVFGRGIVVLNDGTDLSLPLSDVNKDQIKFDVFSGDMVSITTAQTDLSHARYYKHPANERCL